MQKLIKQSLHEQLQLKLNILFRDYIPKRDENLDATHKLNATTNYEFKISFTRFGDDNIAKTHQRGRAHIVKNLLSIFAVVATFHYCQKKLRGIVLEGLHTNMKLI